MAKKNISVVACNGVEVEVMCGANQDSFEDGDVWRFPAELYADISAFSGVSVNGITPTDRTRYENALRILVEAFNEKYKANLNYLDYDVARGQYSRANPPQAKIEQPTATAIKQTATATADTTKNPIHDWITTQYQSGKTEQEIIAQMISTGWKNEQLVALKEFKSLEPIGIPPPPQ